MKFRGSPWPSAERKHLQYDKFMRGWEAFRDRQPEWLITDDSGLPKCGELISSIDPLGLRRLMLMMMHPVPEKRISIHDALNDRWVKTIECCTAERMDQPVRTIDVTDKNCCKLSAKSGIPKVHNHLPPAKRILLHSFEIKEG